MANPMREPNNMPMSMTAKLCNVIGTGKKGTEILADMAKTRLPARTPSVRVSNLGLVMTSCRMISLMVVPC